MQIFQISYLHEDKMQSFSISFHELILFKSNFNAVPQRLAVSVHTAWPGDSRRPIARRSPAGGSALPGLEERRERCEAPTRPPRRCRTPPVIGESPLWPGSLKRGCRLQNENFECYTYISLRLYSQRGHVEDMKP